MQRGTLEVQADLHRGLHVLAAGHEGRERAAGELPHLQGAHQPPLVLQPGGGRRIHLAQPLPQGAGAPRRELVLDPGPHRGVGAGQLEHVQGRAHVESRAAHQDGDPAADADFCESGPGGALEVRDRGLLGDVEDVEEVVGHPAPLLRGRLGGADVHPAVELHGVGVDDLPAQPQGELDAQGGLAGARGPDDGDDRQLRAGHRTGRPGMPRLTGPGPAAPGAAGTPQDSAWRRSQASPARERRSA